MIKDTLREGLTSRVGSKVSGEAKRLVDREVGLNNKHGRPDNLGLLKHVATTTGEDTIDTTNSLFRALGGWGRE